MFKSQGSFFLDTYKNQIMCSMGNCDDWSDDDPLTEQLISNVFSEAESPTGLEQKAKNCIDYLIDDVDCAQFLSNGTKLGNQGNDSDICIRAEILTEEEAGQVGWNTISSTYRQKDASDKIRSCGSYFSSPEHKNIARKSDLPVLDRVSHIFPSPDAGFPIWTSNDFR